jgi:RNA-directed DNA polymerase
MKTYKNLYPKLCSYKNLERAFRKASRGKKSKFYVREFIQNFQTNLISLKRDLETETYIPSPLVKFTIRDPKTRLIRKSTFRDRIVHHAVVNILEPIYEKIFLSNSYANRIDKGTISALLKFDEYKRKVSQNGKLVPFSSNSISFMHRCPTSPILHPVS